MSFCLIPWCRDTDASECESLRGLHSSTSLSSLMSLFSFICCYFYETGPLPVLFAASDLWQPVTAPLYRLPKCTNQQRAAPQRLMEMGVTRWSDKQRVPQKKQLPQIEGQLCRAAGRRGGNCAWAWSTSPSSLAIPAHLQSHSLREQPCMLSWYCIASPFSSLIASSSALKQLTGVLASSAVPPTTLDNKGLVTCSGLFLLSTQTSANKSSWHSYFLRYSRVKL